MSNSPILELAQEQPPWSEWKPRRIKPVQNLGQRLRDMRAFEPVMPPLEHGDDKVAAEVEMDQGTQLQFIGEPVEVEHRGRSRSRSRSPVVSRRARTRSRTRSRTPPPFRAPSPARRTMPMPPKLTHKSPVLRPVEVAPVQPPKWKWDAVFKLAQHVGLEKEVTEVGHFAPLPCIHVPLPFPDQIFGR